MNLSVFLTKENIIFFLIYFAVLIVLIVVCFFIIRAIFRLIRNLLRKIFKKKSESHQMEGALVDRGEDISLQVEELEKSRRETAAAQQREQREQAKFGAKTPPLQYSQPIKSEEEAKTDKKEDYASEEQKKTEALLEKLKHPEEAEKKKKSFLEKQVEEKYGEGLTPKIKIPVSKRKRGGIVPEEEEEARQVLEKQEGEISAIKPTEDKLKEKPVLEAEQIVETETKVAEQEPAVKSPVERVAAQKQSEAVLKGAIPKGQIETKAPGREFVLYPKGAKIQEQTKDKPKTEEEVFPLYEKPEFIKDQLRVGRLKERKEKELEAEIRKIKHPEEEAREEKSFLEERSEERVKSMIGDVPVPEKIEVPVLKPEKEEVSPQKKPEPVEDELMPEQFKDKKLAEKELSPIERVMGQKKPGTAPEMQIPGQKPADYIKPAQKEEPKKEEIPIYEKPEFIKDELLVGRLKGKREKEIEKLATDKASGFFKPELGKSGPEISPGIQKGKIAPKDDASILFGGKEEISRIELRTKLRTDPRVWKAQQEMRLNLKPMERVKLEKKFFSSIYGQNISKRDLKINVKRMEREWASASPGRKETIRKEIKFLKKIGGIK